ncbi:MAG: hypothetical protein NTV84_06080 [Methanoregula sp.]|nr:hypothetical protein [Methanoregula sp.]
MAREHHVRFFVKIKKPYDEKILLCMNMTLADLWKVTLNMWQEIFRSFHTEIDFINSANVTELRERGNPTPFNTITRDNIMFRESWIISGEHS